MAESGYYRAKIVNVILASYDKEKYLFTNPPTLIFPKLEFKPEMCPMYMDAPTSRFG